MKRLIVGLVVLFPLLVSGQELEDVVYLKNGSVIRGVIVEQIPNISIKIKTKDGNIFVLKIEEIMKITKEEIHQEVMPGSDALIEEDVKKRGGKFFLEPSFAIGFPASPQSFSDGFDNSVSFGGGMGKVQNDHVTLQIPVILYRSFGLKDQFGIGSLSIFSVAGNVLINLMPKEKMVPYARIGSGYYHLKVEDADGDTVTENKLGFLGGFGIRMFVSDKAAFKVEGDYEYILTEGDAIGFFSLGVGVSFLMGGN